MTLIQQDICQLNGGAVVVRVTYDDATLDLRRIEVVNASKESARCELIAASDRSKISVSSKEQTSSKDLTTAERSKFDVQITTAHGKRARVLVRDIEVLYPVVEQAL